MKNYTKKKFWEIRNQIYSPFLKNFIPYNELIENIINELNLKSGFHILDAGCGPGIFEMRLLEKKIPNIKIKAVDISKKIIEVAKRNNQNSENLNFEVINLNNKLKYQNEIFDAVVCINVLYLLNRPLETLLEFYRVLKKKGKLIVSTPKSNFNYGILLKSHFLKRKLLKKIRDAIIFFGTFLLIFPLELVINLQERRRKYHRFEKEDIIKLFSMTPFRNLKIGEGYGRQNFLITAEK